MISSIKQNQSQPRTKMTVENDCAYTVHTDEYYTEAFPLQEP